MAASEAQHGFKCLASTDVSDEESTNAELPLPASPGKYIKNFFKEAQLSADGTSVVTLNDDNALRTFDLSNEPLYHREKPLFLSTDYLYQSPTNIQSFALHPYWKHADASTRRVLSAQSEQPIRLTNPWDAFQPAAQYRYQNPNTEEFIAPHSLLFSSDGKEFIAGSRGRIAIFDIDCPTDGPILEHHTKPSNPHLAATSMRDNGAIMSLALSDQSRVLAAGSATRKVGLFPNSGHEGCATAFSVAPEPNDPHAATYVGNGITSMAWSGDGTYLLVAERNSNGIHVYDIRYSYRRLAFLSGRNALTPQRLGMSILFDSVTGTSEVWAGGMDGVVRKWSQLGCHEGIQQPTEEFIGMHGDAVGSVVWHAKGWSMVSCSGSRGEGEHESILKVWSPPVKEEIVEELDCARQRLLERLDKWNDCDDESVIVAGN